MVDVTTVERFRTFVEHSEQLLGDKEQALPTNEFKQFIQASEELLLGNLVERQAEIHSILSVLQRVMLPKSADVLFAAGLTFDENAYTKLLCWAFTTKLHVELAVRCQQKWLDRIGLASAIDWSQPASATTQLVTGQGIPDLVLRYTNRLIIVEAKTGTEEHVVAVSGQMQTEVYGQAALQRLSLEPEFPVDVVFLTTGRDAAANKDARLSSYFEVATAIAEAVADVQPDPVTQAAFGQVVTHLVDNALPERSDLRQLITEGATPQVGEFTTFARKRLRNLLLLQRLVGGLV